LLSCYPIQLSKNRLSSKGRPFCLNPLVRVKRNVSDFANPFRLTRTSVTHVAAWERSLLRLVAAGTADTNHRARFCQLRVRDSLQPRNRPSHSSLAASLEPRLLKDRYRFGTVHNRLPATSIPAISPSRCAAQTAVRLRVTVVVCQRPDCVRDPPQRRPARLYSSFVAEARISRRERLEFSSNC
jgi:hypothetical protein